MPNLGLDVRGEGVVGLLELVVRGKGPRIPVYGEGPRVHVMRVLGTGMWLESG